jgi:hypothetical protein
MRQSWGFCLAAALALSACSTAHRGGDGETDAGSNDNRTDGKVAPTPDAAVAAVNASALTFAIVGDVRPAIPEDTANYPTAIITKIFEDIAAESPAPKFVIATGDYMFTLLGTAAQPMMNLFMGARAAYTGPLYAALGNHECNSFVDGNCATSTTTNYTVFMNTMLAPINETLPYYTESLSAPDNSWTANFTFIACNAWDATQQTWLQDELAKPATYNFVVRHEDIADLSGSPCAASQTVVDANPLTLLLVGHLHEYQHDATNKELINGLGGAPLDSGTNYGYTLVQGNADGTLTVTTKDYMTLQPIDTFQIEANGAAI